MVVKMIKFLPHSALKAQQWEITKGHLRAMAALDGAISTAETERPYRFEKVEAMIEGFIQEFEDAGYDEGMD
jgi:hypothetical protein